MQKSPVVVITGATSGLGQIVAIELAKQGFHLVLTARSKERAAATKKIIQDTTSSAKIDFFYGDLSLMSEVIRIGQEIIAAYPIINVLLNNAGIHAFKPRVTSEGFPEMVAVNYLAPWLLTHILKPSLQNAGKATVVNVASEASRNHGVLKLPEDLTDTAPFTARGSSPIYGKTKLMNIMFTIELARQCSDTSINVNALNPGFNVTGLGRELKFAAILERILKFFNIGNPQKGAEIITRLILDPKYQVETGGYFNVGTGKPITPVQPGRDGTMQKRLWKYTQDLLIQRGFLK
ncbi:SDR family NAD(P)-dependent oxidoreductase [Paenibacillus sp. NPDC056722]|uniref:SDR family NAD(P)-dependent oxidoreductase n=1 Tax=Paenibacillus sp. NPDC056722 TaxID=3345924 RepID=UPI0036BFAD7F